VKNIEKGLQPGSDVSVEIKYVDGISKTIQVICRIDTKNEVEYYKHGGILQYVLRNMLS
jgi:aconitate hydratase